MTETWPHIQPLLITLKAFEHSVMTLSLEHTSFTLLLTHLSKTALNMNQVEDNESPAITTGHLTSLLLQQK